MIVDVPLRGVEHIVHPEAPVGLRPLGDLQPGLRGFRGRVRRGLRRLLHLGRRLGRLRGGLYCGLRAAGGEAQFHGKGQKKCEKQLDGKHCGTFFHNYCSSGVPFAEVPIRYLL